MVTMLKAAPTLPRRSRSITGSRWDLLGLGRRVWQWLAGRLILWQKRLRDREALATMSVWQLSDIGLCREAALREAEKPFCRRPKRDTAPPYHTHTWQPSPTAPFSP